MKLVPILASVVTGFAMLATVGSASASATEYKLSGKFSPTVFLGTKLAGGSFDGTYSYSGGAVLPNSVENFSSFSINLLSANNIVIDTFNSNNPSNKGSIGRASNTPKLVTIAFQKGDAVLDAVLGLKFADDFDGTGSFNLTNISFTNVFVDTTSGPNNGIAFITSATSSPISKSVPEPSMIAGTIATGAVLMMAQLKKAKSFSSSIS